MRHSRDTDDRELVLARWGLVPFFAKSLAEFKGFSTFNARAEGIATSATWRGPFKTRRCLMPADGFYEWKKLDDSKRSARQPFSITLKNGEPMASAGLWDAWKEPKRSPQDIDTWLQIFSIVTTEANEIMAPIHTRMPVILRERDWQRWQTIILKRRRLQICCGHSIPTQYKLPAAIRSWAMCGTTDRRC